LLDVLGGTAAAVAGVVAAFTAGPVAAAALPAIATSAGAVAASVLPATALSAGPVLLSALDASAMAARFVDQFGMHEAAFGATHAAKTDASDKKRLLESSGNAKL